MSSNASKVTVHIGGSIGCSLAVAISWSLNKSILWGLIHGLFGWFYVLYYGVFL